MSDIEFVMWRKPVKCIGKNDTDKRNAIGEFFGWIIVNDRKWAIVQWEGDNDPDLYKANHLLISEEKLVEIA